MESNKAFNPKHILLFRANRIVFHAQFIADLIKQFGWVSGRLDALNLSQEESMKTMSCKQLGGACEKKFHAKSFEEITQMSKQHGMEMFQAKDEAHLKAMNQMQALMQNPEAMKNWFENKKKEFNALQED